MFASFCSIRKRTIIAKLPPFFLTLSLCFFTYTYYFVYLESFQQANGRNIDKTRGKCDFVLSSYVWLPANERLHVDVSGSLMHLMCTYVHNIINSQGNQVDFRIIGWNSKNRFEGSFLRLEQ